MLSILILSQKGEGYEIANKLTQEGHLVKFWQQANGTISQPGGPQAIHRYEEHIEAADLVIDASSRYGGLCESLRKGGKLVLGGGLQDLLTWDEEYAKEVATNLLELEELHPDSQGELFQFGGWFDGNDWQEMYASRVYTRLLDRDRGPVSGATGVVSCTEVGPIQGLASLLRRTQSRGFFSVTTLFSPTVVEFIGFDTSLDNPALFSISELHRSDFGELLYKIAGGHKINSVDSKAKGLCVRLTQLCSEAQVRVGNSASKHFWPSRHPSVLGYVTSKGEDVFEARRRIYRTIDNIVNQAVVYRTDIGV